jgi:3-dehydroquinate synthase
VSVIQVMLGDRSYPIAIRSGSLADVGEAIAKELGARRAFVVTTPRVAEAHATAVAAGMARVHLAEERLLVPEGERAKTLRTASRLYDELLDRGAERGSVLVGLGGGAVGDVVGFVASTFLRGIPLVQVPTTLLAQVDASVGGKTAVNHPRGKNLIGTFYQPRLVCIDPDVLATLPARMRRSGIAEIIKVAAIWDAVFFAWLESNLEAVMRLVREPLEEAITRAVAIKAEVVGLDEREAGLRALLNFGHTLGHAIENVGSYRGATHGEAVAMGMVFAAALSESRGLCPAGTRARLVALLARAGLPSAAPDWHAQRDAYLRAISVDKKIRDEKLGFVVLRELGRAEVIGLAPAEILPEGTA